MIASASSHSWVVVTHYEHEITDPKLIEAYLEILNHEIVHNWVDLDTKQKYYNVG